MRVLGMNSRPFPVPVPHGIPVPFPPPPDSRLRANLNTSTIYYYLPWIPLDGLLIDFQCSLRFLYGHVSVAQQNVALRRRGLFHDLTVALGVHPLVLPVLQINLSHFLLGLDVISLLWPDCP